MSGTRWPALSDTHPSRESPLSAGVRGAAVGDHGRHEDAVHVALSKDEVGALPAVRVGRHG